LIEETLRQDPSSLTSPQCPQSRPRQYLPPLCPPLLGRPHVQDSEDETALVRFLSWRPPEGASEAHQPQEGGRGRKEVLASGQPKAGAAGGAEAGAGAGGGRARGRDRGALSAAARAAQAGVCSGAPSLRCAFCLERGRLPRVRGLLGPQHAPRGCGSRPQGLLLTVCTVLYSTVLYCSFLLYVPCACAMC